MQIINVSFYISVSHDCHYGDSFAYGFSICVNGKEVVKRQPEAHWAYEESYDVGCFWIEFEKVVIDHYGKDVWDQIDAERHAVKGQDFIPVFKWLRSFTKKDFAFRLEHFTFDDSADPYHLHCCECEGCHENGCCL